MLKHGGADYLCLKTFQQQVSWSSAWSSENKNHVQKYTLCNPPPLCWIKPVEWNTFLKPHLSSILILPPPPPPPPPHHHPRPPPPHCPPSTRKNNAVFFKKGTSLLISTLITCLRVWHKALPNCVRLGFPPPSSLCSTKRGSCQPRSIAKWGH